MAKNIKQLWRNGSSDRKKKLDPSNIDDFCLHHAVVPQQENPTDCGFFMNELLETYDGESYAAFSQKDIYIYGQGSNLVQVDYLWGFRH